MQTSSGIMCDVCGEYILPLNPNERVHVFVVAQLPGKELHCDNACKESVLNCGGDWQKLPDGPLRKAYEEAVAKSSNKIGPNLETQAELKRLKQYFPYRIVFASYLDGKFETFADHTKRRMNSILRKGGLIWTCNRSQSATWE